MGRADDGRGDTSSVVSVIAIRVRALRRALLPKIHPETHLLQGPFDPGDSSDLFFASKLLS